MAILSSVTQTSLLMLLLARWRLGVRVCLLELQRQNCCSSRVGCCNWTTSSAAASAVTASTASVRACVRGALQQQQRGSKATVATSHHVSLTTRVVSLCTADKKNARAADVKLKTDDTAAGARRQCVDEQKEWVS